MSSTYGEKIKISIFGQSHGEAIGVVMDGLPAGFAPDLDRLSAFMARRAPGGALATARKESDKPKFVSGLYEGKTCGAPLCAIIENSDTRSGDYSSIKDTPRPGHADYPAYVKHGGNNDVRGGGHFSARLTAPMCIAGGLLLQLLEQKGIRIGAQIVSVADVDGKRFDPINVSSGDLDALLSSGGDLTTLDSAAAAQMRSRIEQARAEGDSVGGVIECCVLGLPVGIGEPVFDGLENDIAKCVFAIPAVKGIEFGAGFSAARMRGSENNDPYYAEGGKVHIKTNNAGGILGGLSSGAPLIFRAAFKPTPSIAREQDSVSLSRGENAILGIKGRHDPCVAVRAVPIVEAATAIALAQHLI
jgi:chorismate synthase